MLGRILQPLQLEAELIQNQNKFVQLQETSDQFKKENDELKKKIAEVQLGNNNLKDRMDLSECFNYSFDLSHLFVYYYVEPHLEKLDQYKNDYYNWRLFNENPGR